MKKKQVYTIEGLAKTFAEHHKKSVELRKTMLQTYKTHLTESEIPKSLKDDFSILKALQTICQEICRIKEKLG